MRAGVNLCELRPHAARSGVTLCELPPHGRAAQPSSLDSPPSSHIRTAWFCGIPPKKVSARIRPDLSFKMGGACMTLEVHGSYRPIATPYLIV